MLETYPNINIKKTYLFVLLVLRIGKLDAVGPASLVLLPIVRNVVLGGGRCYTGQSAVTQTGVHVATVQAAIRSCDCDNSGSGSRVRT